MKNFILDVNPSPFRRFIAMVYDTFLVAAILLASIAIMVGIRVSLGGELASDEVAISGAWRLPSFLFCLFNVSLFFCYFWVKNSQTLGMQAWRLAILTQDNQPISWRQAYSRFFYAMLSFFIFGLGYLIAFTDPKKQTLHDKLSGTKTVLVEKK